MIMKKNIIPRIPERIYQSWVANNILWLLRVADKYYLREIDENQNEKKHKT